MDVHTDEIAVLEVESVQLVAGLLRVHHLLIDDKCSPLGIVGDALPYLSVSRGQHHSLSAYRVMAAAYRIGPNFPKSSKRSSAVALYLQRHQRWLVNGSERRKAWARMVVPQVLDEEDSAKFEVSKGKAGGGRVLGDFSAYRLTSGASFPLRFISWREESGGYVKAAGVQMCGCWRWGWMEGWREIGGRAWWK
jgi:hypothetical protein